MKKTILMAAVWGLALFSGQIFADIPLKTSDEVHGNWKLEYTKKNINTEETMKREDNWDFNNGKVTITHIPREGTYYDQSPVNYVVEDGKLKISILGRSDKFDVFSLYEKNEKSMILKGKFGDVYYFSKK